MKKGNRTVKTNESDNVLHTAAMQFIADCTPFRFSRNLRKLLLDYISQNKDYLPVDFDIYLLDFNNLFELLDTIDEVAYSQHPCY